MRNRSYLYVVAKGMLSLTAKAYPGQTFSPQAKAEPGATTRCVKTKAQRKRQNTLQSSLVAAVLLAVLSLLSLVTQADAHTRTFAFDIPQQRADGALTALADQADISVVFDFDAISQYQANSLKGHYKIQQAVTSLLAGTALVFEFDRSGHLIVTQKRELGGDGEMGIVSKKQLLASTVAFFVGGGSQVSVAQESEPEERKFMLEEVVVTAQKREASMQDVPISITAFSGRQLEDRGIVNSLDLEMFTPGLHFDSSTRIGKLFIRGVGSPQLSGPGADPSSAIYIDGVYQPRFLSSIVDSLDLERVEVLKGPQGTLYGRGLESDARFQRYQILEPTGTFIVDTTRSS